MVSLQFVIEIAFFVVFVFWLGFITGVVVRSRDITEQDNSRGKGGSDVKE